MASFNFGNDPEDLDLSVGGDTGAQQKKAPTPAARPQRPSQPVKVPQATPVVRKPAQQAPAAPRPTAPVTRNPQTTRQQPAQQPNQQAPGVPNFPHSAPPVTPLTTEFEQGPAVPPQSQPSYQPAYQEQPQPVTPDYQQPPYVQPGYQSPQPVTDYAYAPQQPAPVYQSQEPQFAAVQDFEPREPEFMTRTRDSKNMPTSTPQPESVADGSGQKVTTKLNPLQAFFAPFPIIGQGAKNKVAPVKRAKSAPKNDYAGARQKVLFIRVAVFAIAGIVLLAGLRALLFPYQGPTRTAVVNAAQESINYTGFPDDTGQGVALGFTNVFLNYTSSTTTQRTQQLLNYTTDDVLGAIDIAPNGAVAAQDAQFTQKVTGGPYVVKTQNIDATHALITTATQVNNSTWYYLAIPLAYDKARNAISVNASPSFVPKINVAPVNVDNSTYAAKWQDDADADNMFKTDLQNYLRAWGASETGVISRYVTNDATLAARQGLGGAVTFSSLSDGPSIEYIDPKSGVDTSVRRGEFTVRWENPVSHLLYTQRYRVDLKLQNKHWFVQNITNVSLIPGK